MMLIQLGWNEAKNNKDLLTCRTRKKATESEFGDISNSSNMKYWYLVRQRYIYYRGKYLIRY